MNLRTAYFEACLPTVSRIGLIAGFFLLYSEQSKTSCWTACRQVLTPLIWPLRFRNSALRKYVWRQKMTASARKSPSTTFKIVVVPFFIRVAGKRIGFVLDVHLFLRCRKTIDSATAG